MLKAKVMMPNGVVVSTEEGVPQGGPLSPLLSNIVLDDLDRELEERGHRFVRFADDRNGGSSCLGYRPRSRTPSQTTPSQGCRAQSGQGLRGHARIAVMTEMSCDQMLTPRCRARS
jgi:hypothetical protein